MSERGIEPLELEPMLRPSFDDIYMNLAVNLSKRSHCVKAQVGAVLAKDTRIVSLGYNGSGELGDSSNKNKTTPQILKLKNIRDLVLGYWHTIAILNDGSVLGWGNNNFWGLKEDSTFIQCNYPKNIPGLACNYKKTLDIYSIKNTCNQYQFFSDSSYKYHWFFEHATPDTSNSSTPEVSYSDSGVFKIKLVITSATGIKDSVEKTISVTGGSARLAAFNPVCENDYAFDLTGGSPLGGKYSGPGVYNGKFFPFVAGTGDHKITYTYVHQDGCVDSAFKSLRVNSCTSIEEAEDLKLSVFPNPTKDKVCITVNDNRIHSFEIQVKNLLGQMVGYNKSGYSKQVEIDLGKQPKGIYFLEISSDKATEIKRLILK